MAKPRKYCFMGNTFILIHGGDGGGKRITKKKQHKNIKKSCSKKKSFTYDDEEENTQKKSINPCLLSKIEHTGTGMAKYLVVQKKIRIHVAK